VRLGRFGVEYVPRRFRRWAFVRYPASTVLALGALLFRWWRR
jgi:hypothetical protein